MSLLRDTTRWSKEDIRSARRIKLAPLLRQRGFTLREHGADNYSIDEIHGVIVKNCFWYRKDDLSGGNTIDFFVKVLNMSFSATMKYISESQIRAS